MVTQREIARRAGVSIGTVDRVLHDRGEVAPKTQEKIKKIIKELQYKPNLFARHLKQQKVFRFAVSLPNPKTDNYSSYWELPIQGIKKAQKELAGQKVEVDFHFYSQASVKEFQKRSERILQERYDGLLIAPMFYDAAEKFIGMLPPEFPYVFIDSKIPDTEYLTYLGHDSFQSGIVSGMLMSHLLPKGGEVGIIGRKPRDYHVEERIKGFHSYFGSNRHWTLTVYYYDSNNPEKESTLLPRRVYENSKNLRGLFIAGGPAELFARLIQRKNRTDLIYIVGYDLIPENRRCLKEGMIKYIISQRPQEQGYQGIYSLYRRCVLREKPQKEVLLPIDIIAKENVDYYW